MEISELRIGNIIKISPRPNEEGILFLTDIQHSSVIGEMISPRLGYHFRIKHNEILPLEVEARWLEKLEFKALGDGVWSDSADKVRFRFSTDSGFLMDDGTIKSVRFVHEFQNEYKDLTGEELLVTPYNPE